MTFWLLDKNPVQSANRLCWLDCESAAFDGARIIVSAFEEQGQDIEGIGVEPMKKHPLVRWAVVSADNARWLYRYTLAATIKWGKEHKMKDYQDMLKSLSEVACRIDKMLPHRQLTLFGNFYLDDKAVCFWPTTARKLTIEDIESNRAYYERTREHLMWADHNPKLYGGEEE
tara:strand:+ start:336 stop:851 length:516 start_codon:yes stop_codon:yes gene_type:complete